MGSERSTAENTRAGDLIAYDYRVWRVVEVRMKPADLVKGGYDRNVVIEPLRGGKPVHLSCGRMTWIYKYPSEHYPVCHTCGDLMPCREQVIEETVKAEAERMSRYEMPGVCPACREPVSQRQLRQTWPQNLVVPTGQPVTFHLRKRCAEEAMRYDSLWRKDGNVSLLGVTS